MRSRKLIKSVALSLALSLAFALPVFASGATDKTTTSSVNVNATNIAATKATKVTLNKTKTSIFVGSSETLTATVAPIHETDQSVTWKSSKATVATVDKNGTVTALKAGSATITATSLDGKKKATCKVTVKGAPIVKVTGITLNKSAENIAVGDNETLTATLAPTNATNQNVKWKSSNALVATVDSKGVVTGLKVGTSVITATTTDGGKKAACTITVSATQLEPIVISGTGSEATSQFKLTKGLSVITSDYVGSSNFIVQLLNSNGDTINYVANEIGTNKGSTAINISSDGSYLFNVQSSGTWNIEIEQPRDFTNVVDAKSFSGQNDTVQFIKASKGLKVFNYNYVGSSNFIVKLLDQDGSYCGLVANEIGDCSGSKAIKISNDGVYVLSVESNGDWEINIE